MNEHKGITPTQLADRNLRLIGGGKLNHDRYAFLYNQYIQLLSKISADDYASEVNDLLNFENNS